VCLRRAASSRLASGDPGTRTAVLKVLLGIGDPAGVIKRYIRFSAALPGFVRDRSLESPARVRRGARRSGHRASAGFRSRIRSGAVAVAAGFDDIRIVPATIQLLRDPDWWIRISAPTRSDA